MSVGALDGRVAIVTGAAGAIGSATVAAMVAAGARVVAADRHAERLAVLGATYDASSVVTSLTDVRDEDAVRAMVALAVERFGRLDVLHNNAANAHADDTDVVGTPDDVWHDTYQLIVMAAVHACRHAIPVMVERGGGAIVHTSSGAARTATGSRIAYGTSKAALESLSMYIATIHGPQGIRSNIVSPGFVLTDGTRALFDEAALEGFASRAAAGRSCRPDDVADVVVFLASDAARYVSGQVVPVNGGGARAVAW